MGEDLTLLIETDDGVVERNVVSAVPLPAGIDRGIAAETAIRFAAAVWGMPDFIFDPAHESSGSGVREVGDGILVTSGTAIMIQSKSRQQPSGSAERESNWLTKNIVKGLKQSAGSIRFLSARPIPMQNRRRRKVTIDGASLAWISVVIVDHDNVPEGYVPPDLEDDSVVMLRRDWEFLFNQLRSARSVAEYLRRISGENIELGTEPVRYHELALADLAVEPRAAPDWASSAAVTVSVPQAPLEPAGSLETSGHFLLRAIQEDIALSPAPSDDELIRIDVLSRLDSIPVASRTEFGQRLQSYMSEAKAWSKKTLITSTRIYLPVDPGPFESPIVFMVASRLDDLARMVFRARLELQHHDFFKITNSSDLMSVGVLLTPGTTSGRDWDTTMAAAKGDMDLDPEYVAAIRDQLAATLRS
ncbi:hypothetical protein JNB63_17590 [Microbacterium trichothecenolyticum]|uniref:hypothetical protein n=1 Tax=Microbacterium trichothecenolyticum TaxID=69370 RepID=UPI001C6E815C|nr:hypothetical protein [Microbacterium trichothecenolyticum]MBW9121914.1 hypothetical protein [Microbacterium trichothecenolyticum]